MTAIRVAAVLAVALAFGVGTSSAGAVEGSILARGDSNGYNEFGRASSKNGVIAAGNREAALAGRQVLDAGGNAVDAAAATLFAVGVADYGSCGIGGGGFMVYRSASGDVVDTIDFREKSPRTYTFSDTASISGTELAAWGTGHNVVGIPGAVAGMDMALKAHGRMGLARILQPAIDLARDGFTVPKFTADYSRGNLRMAVFPVTAAIYGAAPAYYDSGQKMRNIPLAEDMLELQRLGARAFYDPLLVGGTIARDLLAEMSKPTPYNDQATWEPSDLTGYRAISRPAVRTRYRGRHEYIGMGAPSSAGTAVAEVLNILEGFDLRAAGQSSADHVHLFAEVMKIAWRDRARYLADPAFSPTPAFLTSKDYAAARRAEIDPAHAQPFASDQPAVEGNNTHNIAVIDKWGNAVALNCSIEQPMGSAVTAAGTGFLLNNQLTDFDNVPGHVNRPEPGKRPRSSMAPAILVRDGEPRLVTGGIGGPSIIAGTASAVINVVDFRQDVAHAIDAERADARGTCPGDGANGVQLCVETSRFDSGVLQELARRGHHIREPFTYGLGCPVADAEGTCEYAFEPATHSAGINPLTGLREAASDPRSFAVNGSTALAAVAEGSAQ